MVLQICTFFLLINGACTEIGDYVYPRIWPPELVLWVGMEVGFPHEAAFDLVCMVEAESGFDSKAINENTGYPVDVGLGQINLFWGSGWPVESTGEVLPAFNPAWTEEYLLDGRNNIEASYEIWEYSGGNFSNWHGYNAKCIGD